MSEYGKKPFPAPEESGEQRGKEEVGSKPVFIEIGPSLTPISQERLGKDTVYVGIDISKRLGPQWEDRNKKRKNTFFVRGTPFYYDREKNEWTKIKYPIKDASADTVYIHNVYGEELDGFGSPIDFGTTLGATLTMIKPDGRLVILEDNTPPSRERLFQLLDQAGFDVIDTVDTTHPDWEKRSSEFLTDEEVKGNKLFERNAYMVIAQKKKGALSE